jgi:ATP-dependent RNA helicase DHX8/PRP22
MLKREFKPLKNEGGEEENSADDFNEEDLDIVLNDNEPEFLKGQTSKTGVYLSPVRLVRDQEGSLQREAISAQQFARERRTQKDEATRAIIDSLEGQFNKISDDPLSFGEPILIGHVKAAISKDIHNTKNQDHNSTIVSEQKVCL